MYKKTLLKKTIVFGMVILFLGASVVTAANINLESKNVTNDIKKPSLDTKIFYPTNDAKIAQDAPNKNYGSDPGINIRNEYGGGGSSGWSSDGLYRFDISSIPTGATILKATFYLFYNKWTSTNPAGRMLNVYRLTSNWNEDSVTWITAPTYNPAASAYSPVPPTVNVWMEWDVTGDVQEFVSGTTNYGWRLRDDNYWGTVNIPLSQFRTKEAGQELSPYLKVEYKKSKNYNIITGLDDGPGWIYRIFGKISTYEILEYEEIKYLHAKSVLTFGFFWNVLKKYPNVILPTFIRNEYFNLPLDGAEIDIWPTLFGNNFYISAKGEFI
jgi:hypothetical protein